METVLLLLDELPLLLWKILWVVVVLPVPQQYWYCCWWLHSTLVFDAIVSSDSTAVLRQALKISDRDDVSSVSDKIDAFIKGSNPLAKHRPLVDVIFGLEVGKWVMNWLDSCISLMHH